MGHGIRGAVLALYGGLSGLGEVQHDSLGPGGDFVRQVATARVGGVVLHPDHGELDDLVDVAGTQLDRVAGVERLGLPVLR